SQTKAKITKGGLVYLPNHRRCRQGWSALGEHKDQPKAAEDGDGIGNDNKEGYRAQHGHGNIKKRLPGFRTVYLCSFVQFAWDALQAGQEDDHIPAYTAPQSDDDQ